jgi:hypothetical protein
MRLQGHRRWRQEDDGNSNNKSLGAIRSEVSSGGMISLGPRAVKHEGFRLIS